MQADVLVRVNTLKDKFFIFQFLPKVETTVTYTNGADETKTFTSDANGELALYEPDGIASAVMAMSEKDGETYVGTIFNSDLASGERDIASLQLYPCNNMRMRSISKTTLTFKNPDGTPYSGAVKLRAGVYIVFLLFQPHMELRRRHFGLLHASLLFPFRVCFRRIGIDFGQTVVSAVGMLFILFHWRQFCTFVMISGIAEGAYSTDMQISNTSMGTDIFDKTVYPRPDQVRPSADRVGRIHVANDD